MNKSLTATTLFLVTSFGAANLNAAQVQDCEEANFSISSIMPKTEKTFYNGKVSTYVVDKIEPDARSVGLSINIPIKETNGPEYVVCKVVSGLSDVDSDSMTTTYDSEMGLLITANVREYDSQEEAYRPKIIKVRVNLAKGSVTLE